MGVSLGHPDLFAAKAGPARPSPQLMTNAVPTAVTAIHKEGAPVPAMSMAAPGNSSGTAIHRVAAVGQVARCRRRR
jgi:hypothetical protein